MDSLRDGEVWKGKEGMSGFEMGEESDKSEAKLAREMQDLVKGQWGIHV